MEKRRAILEQIIYHRASYLRQLFDTSDPQARQDLKETLVVLLKTIDESGNGQVVQAAMDELAGKTHPEFNQRRLLDIINPTVAPEKQAFLKHGITDPLEQDLWTHYGYSGDQAAGWKKIGETTPELAELWGAVRNPEDAAIFKNHGLTIDSKIIRMLQPTTKPPAPNLLLKWADVEWALKDEQTINTVLYWDRVDRQYVTQESFPFIHQVANRLSREEVALWDMPFKDILTLLGKGYSLDAVSEARKNDLDLLKNKGVWDDCGLGSYSKTLEKIKNAGWSVSPCETARFDLFVGLGVGVKVFNYASNLEYQFYSNINNSECIAVEVIYDGITIAAVEFGGKIVRYGANRRLLGESHIEKLLRNAVDYGWDVEVKRGQTWWHYSETWGWKIGSDPAHFKTVGKLFEYEVKRGNQTVHVVATNVGGFLVAYEGDAKNRRGKLLDRSECYQTLTLFPDRLRRKRRKKWWM